MRRNLKRLEALERAADKEIFAEAFPFAIAYYLGSARDLSEVTLGYARALGYKELDEFCRASAYLFCRRLESVDGRADHEARIHRARCELLAKFGYDLRRLRPAALADARYRIVKTLPDEWLATIKSLEREWCEDEAALNEVLRDRMNVQEECHPRGTRRRHDKPRQEKECGARRSLT